MRSAELVSSSGGDKYLRITICFIEACVILLSFQEKLAFDSNVKLMEDFQSKIPDIAGDVLVCLYLYILLWYPHAVDGWYWYALFISSFLKRSSVYMQW